MSKRLNQYYNLGNLFNVFIVIVAILFNTNSKAQRFDWAKRSGGNDFDAVRTITSDSKNNVYIAGIYKGVADFDHLILNSRGESDIYVAKYGADGKIIWAKSFGGMGYEECKSICVDKYDNIYITGYITKTIWFDRFDLNSEGEKNMFIAKLDTDGKVLWARASKGGNSEGKCIKVDNNDVVYIAGSFEKYLAIDTILLKSVGKKDIFWIKANSNGNIIYSNKSGGVESDEPNDIFIDVNGNVLITGFFQNMISFQKRTLQSFGRNDIFVVKYNSSGKLLWAKNDGGMKNDEGRGVVVDKKGNVYVTGIFSDTASFNNDSIALASNGKTDIYVAKYSRNGLLLWLKIAGGRGYDESKSIAIDENANIFVTGFFYESADFDSQTIKGSGASKDIFVVKYNLESDLKFLKKFGGSGIDEGQGITVDKLNNFIITGDFGTYGGAALFDNGVMLKSAGEDKKSDVFLIKYSKQ